jgi:hypothetical protein
MLPMLVSAIAAQLAAVLPVQDPACKGEGEAEYRVIDLRRGETRLVVFGARHLTDPAGPIFAEIERRVAELSPTVILVEGQAGNEKATSREIAVRHGGEAGFGCWLAGERGVPCRHADLAEAEEAKRLLRSFSADAVLVYFVVRGLGYFNPRPADQRPPGDLVEWLLRRYAPLVGRPVATKSDLARAWERVMHGAFEPEAVTTEWHSPFKHEMVTQRISREDDGMREPLMIDLMLDAAKPGARVFAIFGEGHVCHLRRPLAQAWEKAVAAPR